nr:MAG TPA: Major capsid protein [Caudoviricetes sp.]
MADMVKRKDFLENEVVDLTEEIKLVSPTDTPLTTMLMGRGQIVKATDITVTWRERELNSERGVLRLEGAEAGAVIVSNRGSLSNVCQIIEKVTQVSGTARALQPKGIGDTFTAEVQDRLIETKRDLEWYFLNGVKTLEADDTPRQMAGLINLVNDNNVVSTAGALSEDHFLDALQKMWEHGAQGSYFAFVNASQKRAINALATEKGNVRWVLDNGSVTNVYGIAVSKIVTDFGEISLVLDRYMDNNTILTLDLDEVQLAELRPTFYEDLPKSGDYFKGNVINECTLKLLNSYAGSKILVTAGA